MDLKYRPPTLESMWFDIGIIALTVFLFALMFAFAVFLDKI